MQSISENGSVEIMRFANDSYWVDVELPDKLSDLIEKAISDYNGLDHEKYHPVS